MEDVVASRIIVQTHSPSGPGSPSAPTEISFINAKTGSAETRGVPLRSSGRVHVAYFFAQLSDEEVACYTQLGVVICRICRRRLTPQRFLVVRRYSHPNALAYDPTTKVLLAVDSKQQSLRVWDVQTGTMKGQIAFKSATKSWEKISLEISLSAAPLRCYSAGNDTFVRMWDCNRMVLLRKAQNGRSSRVSCLSQEVPEKGMIISGSSEDRQVVFWDARELRRVNDLTVDSSVSSCCYRVLRNQVCLGSSRNLSVFDLRGIDFGPLSVIEDLHLGTSCIFDLINPDLFVTWEIFRGLRAWSDRGKMKWQFTAPYADSDDEDVNAVRPLFIPFGSAVSLRQCGIPTLDQNVTERISYLLKSEFCSNKILVLVEGSPITAYAWILNCGIEAE